MSSLFSDPPFPRGQTLLNNENIDLDPNGNPIAGVEIVGTVKVFPDLVPGTGPAAIRNSNRLVFCIAARYTPVDGITKLNIGGTGADKGKWYVLDRRGPLTTLSTVPTGGVMRPMALFIMNSTPKYTGSMPALITTGINTGVRIKTVGTKSKAVPTTMISNIMTSISSI